MKYSNFSQFGREISKLGFGLMRLPKKYDDKDEIDRDEAFRLIDLAMKSRANLAVIPIQDYLEQTNAEGRINIPAVADGNWCYRLSNRYNSAKLAEKIAYVTKKSGRATKK